MALEGVVMIILSLLFAKYSKKEVQNIYRDFKASISKVDQNPPSWVFQGENPLEITPQEVLLRLDKIFQSFLKK